MDRLAHSGTRGPLGPAGPGGGHCCVIAPERWPPLPPAPGSHETVCRGKRLWDLVKMVVRTGVCFHGARPGRPASKWNRDRPADAESTLVVARGEGVRGTVEKESVFGQLSFFFCKLLVVFGLSSLGQDMYLFRPI